MAKPDVAKLRSKKCKRCGAKAGQPCMGAPYRAGGKTQWDEAVHNVRRYEAA